LTEFV